ncbi:hypothetical protein DFH29DRAFT_947993 [Suillus ampliporus]|nr:hypothetical protein DFH29DRAFT_947993 [Suillus ampliporus]
MLTRIHAMYGRSKRMLIFLVVVLLASTIASGVMTVMGNIGVLGEELVLSGHHMCSFIIDTDKMQLNNEILIPTVIWEILALFLAAYIVIKHYRGLRQSSTGSTVGECFTVLIKSHALYFVAFAAVSCFNLGVLSPKIMYSSSVGNAIYDGGLQITQAVQMFILGPRLILSVRDVTSRAKVVTHSDEGTAMTSIAFQERGHVSTSGGV